MTPKTRRILVDHALGRIYMDTATAALEGQGVRGGFNITKDFSGFDYRNQVHIVFNARDACDA